MPFPFNTLTNQGHTNNSPISVEPSGVASALVRISCPDKVGFGCDLARTLFEFGLVVERGDFSTDGKWSFLIFKVRPGNSLDSCPWPLLKQRLEAVCPRDPATGSKTTSVSRQPHFIFQVEVTDRVGLLHDVTQALWERELTVHRAHVSTSPSGTAVDLFYVSGAFALRCVCSTNQYLVMDRQQKRAAGSGAIQRSPGVRKSRPTTANLCVNPPFRHVRVALGDTSAKFSLHPAPTTACRCGATIACDGTICGGRDNLSPPGSAASNAAAAAAAAMEAMEDVADDTCAARRLLKQDF